MSSDYPYAERFGVNRTLPEHGRPRADVLAELHEMAKNEDAAWESGKCSGTMYCGDHEHYAFMNEAFGLFAHVNALQRDICPSQTRFEGEIIAMALDLFHGEAIEGTAPAGLVTNGGTGSICHAVLSYREQAAQTRGVHRPNVIKPETAHPAFDKACHLFGVELRRAPVDPKTTLVDLDWVRDHIDDQTVAVIGSACNYGYGTIDPIADLGEIAAERGVGLHVDGCLGGFILPFGQELGYDIPVFDFRLPGVTSISADTHKYGYAFKGTSTLLFRDKDLRNSQYFFLTDWSGGKYCSPGMEGSRSGGLLAATWASLVSLGREGYRRYAKEIFETATMMQDAVRSHEELRDNRRADVSLLVHEQRLRRVPRERLHAKARLAVQRSAVPQRPSHGGHASTDSSRRRGRLRRRPARSGDVREGAARRRKGRDERCHLRRSRRRDDRRGGRVHPHGDGRHDGPSAVAAAGPGVTAAGSRSGICLAVDLGTGGPKVGFVRFSGEILWHDHQTVETIWSPGGGASQDATTWWQLICEAVRRGLGSGAVRASEIEAVSCTGQWASTVPVDSTGEPVGECVLWMDSRGAPYSRKVIGGHVAGYAPRPALQWIRRSGGAPTSSGADPIGHILYFQNERPEVVAKTAYYLEPVDFLSMRFTGRVTASHASMTASWLTDNRHLDLMAYDPVLVRLSGIDESRLPPLVPTGSVVGAVAPAVAEMLGLPEGVKVVTGTPDLHSAACGAGAVRDFDTHLAISSTAWIGAPVPFKKTDPLHSIVSVPGLSASQYLIANNHETGGLCLQWLRDKLFPGSSYADVLAEAEGSPVGAGKVIFTPWLNGERSPVDDRRARGGFHNVSLAARREPTSRAPCSKGSPSITCGCTRRASPSPAGASTRSASSAAVLNPTRGARSTRTSWTGRSSA